MKEKKKSLKNDVEDTMACSAFAEAGEPCPIENVEEKEGGAGLPQTKKKGKSLKNNVEDTMACSAFAEAGEPCPIDEDNQKKE